MRKTAVLTAVALVASFCCAAAQEMILAKVYGEVRDERGLIVSNATVDIYNAGTTNRPDLYSSPYGAESESNPIYTDADGVYQAYIEPGIYDMKISRQGFTTRNISHVHFTAYAPTVTPPYSMSALQSKNVVLTEWLASSGSGFYRLHKKPEGRDYLVVSPSSSTLEQIPVFLPQYDGYGNHGPLDYAFFHDPLTDLFHLMYIRASGVDTLWTNRWGHDSSSDMQTWEQHAPIMASDMSVSGYNIDMIWAPHVILYDGKWRMVYTGVDRTTNPDWEDNQQRIFYAEMDHGNNLENPAGWTGRKFLTSGVTSGTPWTDYEGITGPTVADYDTTWGNACRDPFILQYEDNWYLYFTALTAIGVANSEAIGVAVSENVDGPYTVLGYFDGVDEAIGLENGGPESLQVIYAERNDTWYMLWSDGGNVCYAVSTGDGPLGPWLWTGTEKLMTPGQDEPSVDINIPEFLAGPYGTSKDHYPSYQSGIDSWLGGFTRHGEGYTADRITFYTTYAFPDSNVLYMTLPYLATKQPMGIITQEGYRDADVFPGRSYDYNVSAGFYSDRSDTASVYVYPYVEGYLDFLEWAYTDMSYKIILTSTPVMAWERRTRHVANTDESNAVASIADENPSWSNWEQAIWGRNDVTSVWTDIDLDEGKYIHMQLQIRATNGRDYDNDDAYDQEFYGTYYREPELFTVGLDTLYVSEVDSLGGNIILTFTAETDSPAQGGQYRWRYYTDGAWVPALWDSAGTAIASNETDTTFVVTFDTELATSALTSDVDSLAVMFRAGHEMLWSEAAEDSIIYTRATPTGSKYRIEPEVE